MSERGPVKSIVTPTRLEYEYTASGAQAEFLHQISQGRLVGQRCPECHKVYCPPSGACPRCGVPTQGWIDVADRGTITTYCVVRVPSENIELKLPYCAANILLDGSDMPMIALLQECDPSEVRIGMRVEAVWRPREEWAPTFENIRYFRPSGEPDVPIERLGGMGLMREVAVLSFAQTPMKRREKLRSEVDMVMSVVREAIAASGLEKREIGFTCSGSSDYIAGQSFAFVGAVDALGAWPPISESHVEMDAAWALYEAWIKLQAGACDSALCFGFGRSSMGTLAETLTLQLDPYTLAPLGIDSIGMAALQARAWLERTGASERDLAQVAARSRHDAQQNPMAQLRGDADVEKLLAEPMLASPLRKHDCAPISDGAAALVIATGELARRLPGPRVWLRGIDHRIEPHHPGVRDLSRSPSTALAASKAGVDPARIEVAELHAPFTHQELILREALGLGPKVRINPSGGALAANPMMSAGLVRIGEAAAQIRSGRAGRALAHATQGHCLQQNLVCWLEGE